MTFHFAGFHRANVDCLFSLSSRGKRGGDGRGLWEMCPFIVTAKKKKEKRGEFTPPLCPARSPSNHSACSLTPADENLVSPKCQSCSSGEKKTCERVVCAVLGKVSYLWECNRPISVYTWNPSVKGKTVLTRFPTKTFPPDSLAAQLSQVDKLCSLSFFILNPHPIPSFQASRGW